MDKKYKILLLSILLDGIGLITSSWVVPLLGDFSDVIWAPLAGFLMAAIYKSTAGKVAGVVTFVEEIVPGLDIIPTFTLMWVYTYLIKGKKVEKMIALKGDEQK